jgi:aminopeptidase
MEQLLQKYAELIVKVGANVQKDQRVLIRATTDNNKIVRLITKEAYLVGAKEVLVQWSDDEVSLLDGLHQSIETMKEVPEYVVKRAEYLVKENVCHIAITSPVPGLLKDVDPNKLQARALATQTKLQFFQEFVMGNGVQWVVAAAPNPTWAKRVFPEAKSSDEAEKLLWEAILKASRVTKDNDPIKEWELHNKTLSKHNNLLNELNFKSLHFKNSLGTDITVELIKDHIWSGGQEVSLKGVLFNPNIPTEETFTMPYKYGVNGKVVATKPLNYQGKLIEDFWLEFKDGKVVNHFAKKEQAALDALLNLDEGSRYLGEIALISHDSPISNMNILFYNTLFDENASCHMALGRAYPMNVKGGTNMTKEELQAIDYNNSLNHEDFMFGSSDMEIVGTKYNGEKVVIFKEGNFVI